ncbi:MAG: CHAT domain-containing protein [Leptolyngbyaceae cyanobacterium]
MTQEFHLSITALGSDRYLIRTEDTAAGVPVAEAQVDWPVDQWLQLAQPAMADPVAGLLQGTLHLGDRTSALHELGSQLYQALFQNEAIRESWLRAQGIAQNRNEILRLRLGLKDSRLQRLPWEVLRHGQQPITTRGNQTFARYAANLLVEQAAELQTPAAPASIQVLMVIASPQDQDHLQLLKEVRQIQAILTGTPEQPSPIQMDILEQPDRSQLAQKLEQGSYQILHYAGHSDFGQNGGDLSLVNRQTGLTERLSGDDLAGLLVNNQVALTIFNSCRSGHTANDDAEVDWRQQNLVQALVNRGVPSVVAMAERIPDDVAIAFTQLFYHNLRQGFPIDVSLSRTRQGLISGFGSDQSYWALPILYLHPDFDGYLTKRDREADNQLHPDVLGDTNPTPLHAVAPMTGEMTGESSSVPDAPNVAATSVVQADGESAHAAAEEMAVTGATATFLNQLEQTAVPGPTDDELLSSYVQQLSHTALEPDEPPLPAGADEVLTDEAPQRSGMTIYDRLPEVSTPSAQGAASPASTGAPDAAIGTRQIKPLYSGKRQQRAIAPPLLVWFALGLIGLVGMTGLSLAALRWAGLGPRTSSIVSEADVTLPGMAPQPADPAVATLIRQAETAIKGDRYADAREDFELALTQALMEKAAPSDVTDAIWPWVRDADQSDLLYVKGRIAWQEIALLEADPQDFDSRFNQRTFAEQARNAWAQTDDTFMDGRIARGFAAYYEGDWDRAIANWEAALTLYDEQRQRQPDPASNTLADPAVLEAYAGLVMAHTRLGNMNLAGLEEDPGLSTASETDQGILNAEADLQRAIAQEYFRRLQALDELNWMAPQNLGIVDESAPGQNNWLWTGELLDEWRRYYRYWETETNSTVLPDPETIN